MKKNLLLILSSKIIDKELQTIYGEIPPVLMNYNKTTLLEGVVNKNKEVFDIHLIGNEKFNLIEELVSNKKLNVSLQKIEKTNSLKDTILSAEDKIKNYENVTVLYGDTIVEDWDLSQYIGDKVAYSLVEEPKKWTTFEVENEEIVLYDKVNREYKDNYKAFIGIMSFSNFELYMNKLTLSDNIYDAFKLYNKDIKVEMVNEYKWVDLGHLEEFYKSKEVQARFFNDIKIQREKGILIKRSQEKEKFQNEIKWYLKMPKQLEYLTPRIFSYDLSYENLYVEMEYYSYETLLNVFVFSHHSLQKWNKIFDLLLTTNSQLSNYKLDLPKDEIDTALKEMYVNKTLQRFEKLKEDEWFSKRFENTLEINGEVFPPLNTVIEKLEKIVEDKLLTIDSFSIIHGDYFFANILYDGLSNFVRLIDPRGDFGGYGIYGDSRYDLAKLSHSVNGNYDLIVSDKFNLEFDENSITYNIETNERQKEIKELFFRKLQDSKEEIILIEALLFLSMIPLHKDYPDRQKIMYATGMRLIKDYL